jgi:hypothetical protein
MTIKQKEYVDKYHTTESVPVMARALCLTIMPVNAYMLEKGYKQIRGSCYKKDNTKVKKGYFDVDSIDFF